MKLFLPIKHDRATLPVDVVPPVLDQSLSQFFLVKIHVRISFNQEYVSMWDSICGLQIVNDRLPT